MISTGKFKTCSIKHVFVCMSCVVSMLFVTLYLDLGTLNMTYVSDILKQHQVTFNKARFAQPMTPVVTGQTLHERTVAPKMKNSDKAIAKTFEDVNKHYTKEQILYNTYSGSKKVDKRKKVLPPPEDLIRVGPFQFLPNYKNPCWLNPNSLNTTKEPPILCLPYFYLIGAPKAGTTDMHHRLVKHPQISSKVVKEPHWLTRKHYSTLRTLKAYQTTFFTAATKEIVKKNNSYGKHTMIFGDCSASTMWDNSKLNVFKEFKNVSEPPYTNADVLYHLNPHVKIIAMVRNPVDRLYSEYLYFSHGKEHIDQRQDFHNKTIPFINFLKRCFNTHSVRHCLYKYQPPVKLKRPTRVGIGIYSGHLQEWFRVFPRKQLLVIKLEDFSKNTISFMKKIFSFLDLDPVSDKLLQKLANPDVKANSRKHKYKSVVDMLPETRRLIEEFYRPFNDELVELLGESFNYNR